MRSFILLFVNGREHRVAGEDAFLTLSTFLRDRLKLCGTKNVCNEGDCGSCSTLCGRLDEAHDQVRYQAIDSCIRFVFQLDGCHIVTVEGLAPPCNGAVVPATEPSLSPVQQAMVDCHGSQCGFCTPGFVVAMTGILEDNDDPSVSQWRDGLTGNLCRCTGYSPIISAGLESAKHHQPQHAMNQRYPAAAMRKTWSQFDGDDVLVQAIDHAGETQKAACPSDLDTALQILADEPDATLIAGATEWGVRFNKVDLGIRTWLDLNRVDELTACRIEEDEQGDAIVLGGRATWTDLEELTRDHVPQFYGIVKVFGSPQIRNVGTIGGNIINASPIADSLPFLMACDAVLTLTSQTGRREVPINDFYLGYKNIDLHPGELLEQIRVPLPPSGRDLKLYKVSRRLDMDISTFTAAIWMDRDGDRITDAGIAYGAVGPVVLRLRKTESFLRGKPFSLETMQSAGEVAVGEISPLTDVRGGADFRLQLARNVLQKFYHEITVAEVSV